MKKKLNILKFVISIILITSMFSINLYSATEISFSDVKSTDWFYKDVATLVDKAVINGYEDGTFGPDKLVSVAEFIKMSLVATNQILVEPVGTHWYSKFVETAIAKGYISQTYYKDYERPITRGEMSNIIDEILDLSYDNTSSYINKIVDYGSIASYYKESSLDVYIAGIIIGYEDGTIQANNKAKRSEAATVIVRMINPARRCPPVIAAVSDSSSENPKSSASLVTKSISVDGIQIGMSEDYVLLHLGEPEERLLNQYGYEWFIYAGDYSTFKLLGIKEGKVVLFYSNVKIDSTIGIEIGSTDNEVRATAIFSELDDYYYALYKGMNIRLFSIKGVNDGIEGMLVYDSKAINSMNPTRESLDTMERVLFHLINGARKANGLNPLLWSIKARAAAYSHSEDMGVNNYFAHNSQNGQSSKERMQAFGIVGNYYAENIAAGYVNPFDFHYTLMHSSGHKNNILSEKSTHIGVGIYYNSSAKYRYYLTENFYKQR